MKLERSPFHVVDRLREWPRGEGPRRAAQSSIGLGGSNAHAIFEEYAAAAPAADDRSPQLVPLSARTRDNLAAYARELRAALASPRPTLRLRDVAYTLQVGRVAMAHRVAFVVRDLGELADELALFLDGRDSARRFTGEVPRGAAADGPAAKVARWLEKGEEKGKLKKLAQAWVRGADVEWRQLARTAAGRRTSLPAYPFSRVVHPWPARAVEASGPAPAHPCSTRTCPGSARSATAPGSPARSSCSATTWSTGSGCSRPWRAWRWRTRPCAVRCPPPDRGSR